MDIRVSALAIYPEIHELISRAADVAAQRWSGQQGLG